jgi:hypothetical protein
MSTPIPNGRPGRAVAIAGLILGAAAFMFIAFAGGCPADQAKANGATDMLLATVDLAKEQIKAEERLQRVRKLVVAPGGVVPWHSDEDRPALIYDIEGEINEYNANCSVPIMPWDCVLDPVRVRPSWSEP